MEVKTKYDFRKRVAIIKPIEIVVAEMEYKAIQKVTDGQFGYFCITGRIKLKKGSIIGLNLSGLEVQANDLCPYLANLNSLERLNLEHNSLKKLPEVIGNLTNLEELHISYNQLTSLPNWIKKLKSLQEIYAGENEIKTLPQSMRKMKSLEYFVIRSNPLNDKAKVLIKELKESGVKIV